MIGRRKLLTGLASFICAPAIVRASSLMAISPVPRVPLWTDLIGVMLDERYDPVDWTVARFDEIDGKWYTEHHQA